jgi:glycosyltransferase involved in cell wall biosynthesis
VKVSVFKRAIRSAAKLADAIVCVSGPTATRLRELLDPQCPVHVIPHGVDHELFRPSDDEAADLAALEAFAIRPPYIGFWGTLEPRKDLATLVRAFDRLAADHPALQLVIAGGSGWGNDRFEAAVKASPHADRIVRTGYVEDGFIPAMVRRAAAVVYAAIEEGFGLPAVEALACGGAPLVTTRGSVMDELTDGAAWLAPAGDDAALADVLDGLLAPASEAERARQRARGLEVASRFTWDATAAGHESVYRSVARR